MKISYVSNIKLTEYSGGMSGINKAVYDQLSNRFQINGYAYINPPTDFLAKVISKFWRLIGRKGNYHFFSKKRLNKIAKNFKKSNGEVDAYFFFGFTPWIHISPNKPYFCYNDACFGTYVDIYNNKQEFSFHDLNRIYQKEKEWLKNAKMVFFNSNWALEQTKRAYQLEGSNFINVGFGGFIDIPKKDIYKDGYNFLFISREFIPKGGAVVVEAIRTVRQKYPEAKLWIVGDAPPNNYKEQEFIEYKGFFSKSNPEELKTLKEFFSTAFCLVHPTIKDANPLVVIESAYFGCSAISSNRFAIPEFIDDGATGYLLDNPRDTDQVAEKMLMMIENPDRYQRMRINSREKALQHFTWERVGKQLHHYMSL